jgi:hypothetical protein
MLQLKNFESFSALKLKVNNVEILNSNVKIAGIKLLLPTAVLKWRGMGFIRNWKVIN